MSYIGKAPGNGIRYRYYYTATSAQTTFSGVDDNGATLQYADSKYMDVYLNGVLLVAGTDYTATSGTSIVLTSAASTSDNLEAVAYDVFSLTDAVSATNGGTFGGSIGATGFYNNSAFYENAQSVSSDYTLNTSRNAMSVGPITIDSGVTITIPTGGRYVVI